MHTPRNKRRTPLSSRRAHIRLLPTSCRSPSWKPTARAPAWPRPGNTGQVEEIEPAGGLRGSLGEDLELRRGHGGGGGDSPSASTTTGTGRRRSSRGESGGGGGGGGPRTSGSDGEQLGNPVAELEEEANTESESTLFKCNVFLKGSRSFLVVSF